MCHPFNNQETEICSLAHLSCNSDEGIHNNHLIMKNNWFKTIPINCKLYHFLDISEIIFFWNL
jgi:hypothetical protein